MLSGTQVLDNVNGSTDRLPPELDSLYKEATQSLSDFGAQRAIDKLHEVSLKVVDGVANIVSSNMSDKLKDTALRVLYKVADRADGFEKLVSTKDKGP